MTELTKFLKDSHDRGVWYAVKGETFGQSAKDFFLSVWDFLVTNSDFIIVGSLIFSVLFMCGSARAGGWLKWSIIGYLLIQVADYAVKHGI